MVKLSPEEALAPRWSPTEMVLFSASLQLVWIEHVVHALVATVDRLVVLHGGGVIADGAPAAVIRSPAVREIYMGIPTDA